MKNRLAAITRMYAGDLDIDVEIGHPGAGCAGLATWRDGRRLIIISEALTDPRYVAAALFHEVGHHVLGHVAQPGAGCGLLYEDVAKWRQAFPEDSPIQPALARLQAVFDECENEAHAFSVAALVDYENQHGGFDAFGT